MKHLEYIFTFWRMAESENVMCIFFVVIILEVGLFVWKDANRCNYQQIGTNCRQQREEVFSIC